MVLAYHCVVGFYGFWLPNGPRGFGSDYIANWELLRYDGATKVLDRRRSRAGQPAIKRQPLDAAPVCG